MDEIILELRNITKTFGKLVANDSVSLKVKKGTVHAIVGENGAGKSTLMSIITNLQRPDSGEILLRGKPVVFTSPMDAAAHGIGMVYQEFMLCMELSVLDNILLGFEPRICGAFINRKAARKKIIEICETYNFNIPLDSPLKICLFHFYSR